MTYRCLITLFLLLAFSFSQAQQHYYVFFSDKPQIKFDPHTYFHPKALERRMKNGLPLWDKLDLPLDQNYVLKVTEKVDSVRHQLRWLNALTVVANPYQIADIQELNFVDSVKPFLLQPQFASFPDQVNKRFDTLLSLTRDQMKLDLLAENGLTGKGVRIAVFDAGFKHGDRHPALAEIRANKRIIATKDFYDGDDGVYHHSLHGMQVLSCIGGKYQGRGLGVATDAEFLLARIEKEQSEKLIEEDNWIAAAQWADQMGADIINSSVNYTYERYSYKDMNGKTAPVSTGAKIAAMKGILVVCSMGNEGDKRWKYMGAPADVPEVLSVGGSLSMIPMHIKFASIGPNAKDELKPDVAAPGFVLSAIKKDRFGENAGTSFSAPLISGFAAALIQKYPKKSRSEIFQIIKETGHFYPYFDYYLGYGVPNAEKLFSKDSTEITTPFEVIHLSDSVVMKFDTTFMLLDSINYPNGRPIYYHLANEEGVLLAYFQIRLPSKSKYYYFRRQKGIKGTLRIWFQGYLYEEELTADF